MVARSPIQRAMTLSFDPLTCPDWTTRLKNMMRSTGELIAWVRIPSLNTNVAASDTVIYIYYGNSDVASSTQNVSAVWDSNYVGVWHLDESPANGGYPF